MNKSNKYGQNSKLTLTLLSQRLYTFLVSIYGAKYFFFAGYSGMADGIPITGLSVCRENYRAGGRVGESH
jgi:hypothetical protein